MGVTGILVSDALMGEISPAISTAVSQSPAVKILILTERCGLKIVGSRQVNFEEALNECVEELKNQYYKI